MRKSVSVSALHHAKETENRTEKLEQQRNKMKRKQRRSYNGCSQHELVAFSGAALTLLLRSFKVHGEGKGMILTPEQVSILALSFFSSCGLYRLHNICLKFLAPWVLPDPYEKPNTISLWKEPLAYLEPFSGPLKNLLQPLWASSIFLFLPHDRQVCKP